MLATRTTTASTAAAEGIVRAGRCAAEKVSGAVVGFMVASGVLVGLTARPWGGGALFPRRRKATRHGRRGSRSRAARQGRRAATRSAAPRPAGEPAGRGAG
ncbi:hypothetical protein [Pseudonocardia asaccharolytica]|uniref:Uncharacterized protein n=1 Tax=Pseudonocardia asaccharolytica DSM 44247 = NBRC 16224 TaxID=1123024 RepID=A0A511D5Z0_9PSEU|nr:hypothetical protein [Pseudonocardia asaccharolytica]GEL20206.1 hypothetical protein PA7_40430 [Pseudonocardia asaccharolytica DSM 44247 = NBRC 16224]